MSKAILRLIEIPVKAKNVKFKRFWNLQRSSLSPPTLSFLFCINCRRSFTVQGCKIPICDLRATQISKNTFNPHNSFRNHFTNTALIHYSSEQHTESPCPSLLSTTTSCHLFQQEICNFTLCLICLSFQAQPLNYLNQNFDCTGIAIYKMSSELSNNMLSSYERFTLILAIQEIID